MLSVSIFFQGFRNRHPEISMRKPERVSKARVGVTEKAIRAWFADLIQFLKDEDQEDVFSDPSRVFNSDETCID